MDLDHIVESTLQMITSKIDAETFVKYAGGKITIRVKFVHSKSAFTYTFRKSTFLKLKKLVDMIDSKINT